MNDRQDIVDHAILWHLRLRDASEAEWRDLVRWLESSPEHAAAYDRIVTDDVLVDALRRWRPRSPRPC